MEQERREGLGLDSETTALALKDNVQLSKKGAGFAKSFTTDFCKASFPSLPSEGVESIVGHLTSLALVAYVARNLGVEDLTMCAECPVPDNVLHSTLMAVIGALLESSGAERAGLFLRVGGLLQSMMGGVSVFCLKKMQSAHFKTRLFPYCLYRNMSFIFFLYPTSVFSPVGFPGHPANRQRLV